MSITPLLKLSTHFWKKVVSTVLLVWASCVYCKESRLLCLHLRTATGINWTQKWSLEAPVEKLQGWHSRKLSCRPVTASMEEFWCRRDFPVWIEPHWRNGEDCRSLTWQRKFLLSLLTKKKFPEMIWKVSLQAILSSVYQQNWYYIFNKALF